MRVLVYPHDLGMGGSQTNAIELAAEMRELGVEPVIFGRPGVLNARIDELQLEFIASPEPGRRPSLPLARHLAGLVRERRIDVLHGYEWPPSLECAAASVLVPGTAAVSTVMSMAVPPFIPRSMPLVVGTEQIADVERAAGRHRVAVLEPPVDLGHNVAPPAAEVAAFRRAYGIAPDRLLVVCVTRLVKELKAEGLFSAIAAMGILLAGEPVHLLIVGDGPARPELEAAAAAVNGAGGGARVVLAGQLLDPRPAYAAADVVLGMGGSALRALAFGKPLIVQGEQGFFELLTPESRPTFQWQGWYGVGAGSESGPEAFTESLRPLLASAARRAELGAFGAGLVRERFSLAAAARRQVEIYQEALAAPARPAEIARSFAVAGGRFTDYYVRRRVARLRGHAAADDFNARPVAARAVGARAAGSTGGAGLPEVAPVTAARLPGTLVYLAGAPWHAVVGTDVQLATALGERRPVLWVDPPDSLLGRLRGRESVPTVSQVAPGVTRLHPLAPPGVSRWGVRTVSRWWSDLLVRRHVRQAGQRVGAVIASSPEPVLAGWRSTPAQRVYFATDDFVAGSGLLGISERYAARSRERNLAAATSVLAVSEPLARELDRGDTLAAVLPNGCDTSRYAELPAASRSARIKLPGPLAGVVGQFNARLDLGCLEAVADRGVALLLVGPRYDRDPRFTARFDRLIARPNVQWVDRRPAAELPEFMAALTVGLTPYADTDFNRASFPLKTLEYLTAGLPVISSDLPAARSLDPRYVEIAPDPEAFARATLRILASPRSDADADARRAYAREHSWQARARQLDELLAGRA